MTCTDNSSKELKHAAIQYNKEKCDEVELLLYYIYAISTMEMLLLTAL